VGTLYLTGLERRFLSFRIIPIATWIKIAAKRTYSNSLINKLFDINSTALEKAAPLSPLSINRLMPRCTTRKDMRNSPAIPIVTFLVMDAVLRKEMAINEKSLYL
jgi:hypothetical protein